MTRTINFDQFRAEQRDEPVVFIIGGEEYALPASLPASMAVDMMRMQAVFEDEDQEVPNDVMDQFGRSLFGVSMWEDLLKKHRITVNEVSPLMERVFEVYTEAPKDETPGTPAPTSTSPIDGSGSISSAPGTGSRPTSSESTASISPSPTA
jgi:hypothetical protein